MMPMATGESDFFFGGRLVLLGHVSHPGCVADGDIVRKFTVSRVRREAE
ncbi:hypothetical protein [Desulfobacter sp. UBA2225]|jgi:hypothetical protein|nr:hypothetical protein [Desulfobacter sp. UBA2225]